MGLTGIWLLYRDQLRENEAAIKCQRLTHWRSKGTDHEATARTPIAGQKHVRGPADGETKEWAGNKYIR